MTTSAGLCAACEKAPRPGDRRPFCDGCETRIRRALLNLPGLHDQLRRNLQPTGTAGGGRVSGTKSPPLPLREDVATLIDNIEGALASWEDALHEANRWPAPSYQHLGVTVRAEGPATEDGEPPPRVQVWQSTADLASRLRPALVADRCRWLARHLPALLAMDPGGEDAGTELLKLEASARRALGTMPLRHHLPAPCPSCDRRALVRDDGSETVLCGACARDWQWDEYDRLVVVLASQVPVAKKRRPKRIAPGARTSCPRLPGTRSRRSG